MRAVFVDFSKDFDLVNHNILFHKLLKYNIPNFLLKRFGSYLLNRQQRLRANSLRLSHLGKPSMAPCHRVPGLALSPFSYSLMICTLVVRSINMLTIPLYPNS